MYISGGRYAELYPWISHVYLRVKHGLYTYPCVVPALWFIVVKWDSSTRYYVPSNSSTSKLTYLTRFSYRQYVYNLCIFIYLFHFLKFVVHFLKTTLHTISSYNVLVTWLFVKKKKHSLSWFCCCANLTM